MQPVIQFACQPGCTKCCEQQGFVYLTEADILRLADYLGMKPAAFEKQYVFRTRNKRRLRVPRHAQCSFLKSDGCAVHPAKPTQCRTFPWWPELVGSAREWHKTAKWCPGIGKGQLISIEKAREDAEEMRRELPELYP